MAINLSKYYNINYLIISRIFFINRFAYVEALATDSFSAYVVNPLMFFSIFFLKVYRCR